MNAIQQQHELAVGDEFIQWYNKSQGTRFTHEIRAGEVPDVVYRDGGSKLLLEIVDCYYDSSFAKFLWNDVRGVPNVPQRWHGRRDFEEKLLVCINEVLKRKCEKRYGPNTILVLNIHLALSSAERFESMLLDIRVP